MVHRDCLEEESFLHCFHRPEYNGQTPLFFKHIIISLNGPILTY